MLDKTIGTPPCTIRLCRELAQDIDVYDSIYHRARNAYITPRRYTRKIKQTSILQDYDKLSSSILSTLSSRLRRKAQGLSEGHSFNAFSQFFEFWRMAKGEQRDAAGSTGKCQGRYCPLDPSKRRKSRK